jgi:glutaredoxin
MEIYLIYGITDCPACLRAQAKLMEKNIEYVFIETDFSKTYRAALRADFEWSTFPMIVKVSEAEEEFIGGYDDLQYVLEKDFKKPT